ncbi:MAG: FlgD immunoglobulin-like domain containing protein [Candidatus Zixiibacteriota bacterium]
MSRARTFFSVTIVFMLPILMAQQITAEILIDEDFSTDVIALGEWTATDASVAVDVTNGWLHIAPDAGYNDGAYKFISIPLPAIVEIRMRLVSGGRNYTLPSPRLYYGPTDDYDAAITYVPNTTGGWHFLGVWTDVHTMGPEAENTWLTVKAIIRADGGELLAKLDEDEDFTAIVARNWTLPDTLVRLALHQPWDAVCDFDYVRVISEDQQTSHVALDIKPGSCPNPLNISAAESEFWMNDDDIFDDEASGDFAGDFMKVSPGKKRGVLPVAILGTEDFDVSEINVTTVLLEGVSPLRNGYEDVSTPVGEDADECECTEAGPDGFTDVTLKFDKTEVVTALGEINVGDVIPLEITGQLLDGTSFSGTDCVVIVGNPNAARVIPDGASMFGLVNHPNPFNPATDISFSLPADSYIKLVIFNIMGQRISTLVNDHRQAGSHTVTWNGRDDYGTSAASGVYFYRIEAGEYSDCKKMVLMK